MSRFQHLTDTSSKGHLQERVVGRVEWSRILWLNSLITNALSAETLNRSAVNVTELVAKRAVPEYS